MMYLDKDRLIKKLVVAMCENMSSDVDDHDGSPVNDELANEYIDSCRDIWRKVFSADVKVFNDK